MEQPSIKTWTVDTVAQLSAALTEVASIVASTAGEDLSAGMYLPPRTLTLSREDLSDGLTVYHLTESPV